MTITRAATTGMELSAGTRKGVRGASLEMIVRGDRVAIEAAHHGAVYPDEHPANLITLTSVAERYR